VLRLSDAKRRKRRFWLRSSHCRQWSYLEVMLEKLGAAQVRSPVPSDAWSIK
jgi:hypothetical protein